MSEWLEHFSDAPVSGLDDTQWELDRRQKVIADLRAKLLSQQQELGDKATRIADLELAIERLRATVERLTWNVHDQAALGATVRASCRFCGHSLQQGHDPDCPAAAQGEE